jgi:DNA adenine methylase
MHSHCLNQIFQKQTSSITMIYKERTPERPVLRYHGGKWKLAGWITEHFPAHRIYTEAFGGAASVLLQKQRCQAEVYNDLDSDLVNLFRILRDEDKAKRLFTLLKYTPYSREEFNLAYQATNVDIEKARRLIVRSFMGFGSAAHNSKHKTGFRSNSNRSGTTPAHDWNNYPAVLESIVQRLRGVVIENRSALQVLKQHDSTETLHYVDPPYELSTRSSAVRLNNCYKHEMTTEQHIELANTLHSMKGMVVISGYASDLYDKELYREWFRVTRKSFADGARKRIEILWMNNAVINKLNSTIPLFK